MSNRRYQLIEALPYPRATRAGHLRDAAGVPLHGTYERKLAAGYRAALINNGRVVHRYDYPSSLVGRPTEGTRSFSNLVHTLDPWLAPDDAERPVTNYPASESSFSGWRPLWHEPVILDSVIRGTKRVGLLAGSPAEIEQWTATAGRHGLFARQVRAWTLWNGDPRGLSLITRPDGIASHHDLATLEAEYAVQLPFFRSGPALDGLSRMTGAGLSWYRLVNPVSEEDLVISGYCFGYPVASTVACISGTHG